MTDENTDRLSEKLLLTNEIKFYKLRNWQPRSQKPKSPPPLSHPGQTKGRGGGDQARTHAMATPTGHTPQKEGGVTDGEERETGFRRSLGGGWRGMRHGEGRSLKSEQRGPLRGRHMKPSHSVTDPTKRVPRRPTGGR